MINRNEFLKLAGASFLGLLLPPSKSAPITGSTQEMQGANPPQKDQETHPQPNILIIVLDALSALHLQEHGYPRETMPNLSMFLDNAVVFHQHYAAGNFTSPGTGSLLTGTLPWTHRAINHNGRVLDQFINRNIFSAFSDYYRISYTHNSLVNSLFRQFSPGIDQSIPREELFLSSDRLIDWLFKNDYDAASVAWLRALKKGEEGYAYSLYFSEIYQYFVRDDEEYKKKFPFGLPVTNNDNYFLLEDAINYMMVSLPQAPQPFLAYYHFLPPHYPYNTRKDFYQVFRNDGYLPTRKPKHLLGEGYSEDNLGKLRRFYDEFILYADAEFGRLFNHLRNSGLLENTWVVLTSDHGELFERGVFQHTTPLMNQAILRIPLVIWEPGRAARLDVQQKTSAVDVFPTLLQVTDHPEVEWSIGSVLPPYAVQGKEKPILAVEAKTTPKDAPITVGSVAYLKDQYKLIHYFGYPELGDQRELNELYDIEADPEELQNLAETKKGIKDEYLDTVKEGLAAANQPYVK